MISFILKRKPSGIPLRNGTAFYAPPYLTILTVRLLQIRKYHIFIRATIKIQLTVMKKITRIE